MVLEALFLLLTAPLAGVRVELIPATPGSLEAGTLDVEAHLISQVDGPGITIHAAPSKERIVLLGLPFPGKWQLSCRSEVAWCLPMEIEPRFGVQMAALPVWSRTTFRGRFAQLAGSAAPPAELLIQARFRDPGAWQGAGFTVTAPLVGPAFEFVGPQALLDLRLALPSYSPIYIWDLDARGNAKVNLGGPFELRDGASLCAFVVDRETRAPLEGLTVQLGPPLSTLLVDGGTSARQKHLTNSATTDLRGFFQISGSASGSQRLEVSDPTGSRPHLTLEPIELEPRAETCLPDLEMPSFITARILTTPATDPWGRAWRVSLRPQRATSASTGDVGEMTAGTEGIASFRLAPGSYHLTVEADEGQRLLSRMLEIGSGGDFAVDIPVLLVDGNVRLQGQPIAARVRVESGQGEELDTASDQNGNFRGLMTAKSAGLLPVAVSRAEPPLHVDMFVPQPAARDGVTHLKIDLAGPAARGVVLDSEGNGVSGAEVVASATNGERSWTRTDADGHFFLPTTPASATTLVAQEAAHGSAELSLHQLPSLEGVTLVLEEARKVRGRVLSATGEPVPGAQVLVVSLDGAAGGLVQTRTDFLGRFEAGVARAGEVAVVQVRAPTQFLWSGCLSLPAEEELIVRLPHGPSGSLGLELREGPTLSAAFSRPWVIITGDGGILRQEDLFNWILDSEASDPGELLTGVPRRILVPGVAPGRYLLAVSSADIIALAQAACFGTFSAATGWQELTPAGSALLTAGADMKMP